MTPSSEALSQGTGYAGERSARDAHKSMGCDMTEPNPLSLEREELKAKSLGEKMFDALHYDSRTKSAVWSSVPDRSRDYYEIAGMAFAASLTHDETTSAVIASLTARVERLEAGMRIIAEGTVSSAPEGHYLAHRAAVKIARSALSPVTQEGTDER